MIKDTLVELFERDIQKLKTEINLYKDEDNLWIIKEGISNSAGNLCLHLVGNLNHFIGAVLGNSGYVRHRDDEFSLKNIPRQDLITNIDNCILILKNTFSKLTDADMDKDFPFGKAWYNCKQHAYAYASVWPFKLPFRADQLSQAIIRLRNYTGNPLLQ